MTTRLKGCYVAFEQDVREDDAEAILAALRMVRGVAGVEPVVSDPADWLARTRVRSELQAALWEAIRSVLGPRMHD